MFFIYIIISDTENPSEDKSDLYYWTEVTRQHTHTFKVHIEKMLKNVNFRDILLLIFLSLT